MWRPLTKATVLCSVVLRSRPCGQVGLDSKPCHTVQKKVMAKLFDGAENDSPESSGALPPWSEQLQIEPFLPINRSQNYTPGKSSLQAPFLMVPSKSNINELHRNYFLLSARKLSRMQRHIGQILQRCTDGKYSRDLKKKTKKTKNH